LDVALTVPKVMLRSLISPGWKEIMQVWAYDPAAGSFLRCTHGVSTLLQCLEDSPSIDVLSFARKQHLDLQNHILMRFVRALQGEGVQPALVSALAWTTHLRDIWTKQEVRKRLARVLRRLVWSRLGERLPGFCTDPLPEYKRKHRKDMTAELVLPDGEPGPLRVEETPLRVEETTDGPDMVVQLPACPLPEEQYRDDVSDQEAERVVLILGRAVRPAHVNCGSESWLSKARDYARKLALGTVDGSEPDAEESEMSDPEEPGLKAEVAYDQKELEIGDQEEPESNLPKKEVVPEFSEPPKHQTAYEPKKNCEVLRFKRYTCGF